MNLFADFASPAVSMFSFDFERVFFLDRSDKSRWRFHRMRVKRFLDRSVASLFGVVDALNGKRQFLREIDIFSVRLSNV